VKDVKKTISENSVSVRWQTEPAHGTTSTVTIIAMENMDKEKV
jgi:hypothetical protein